MQSHSPRAQAIPAAVPPAWPGPIAAGMLAVVALLAAAAAARAQDTVITAHGIKTFGELQYPADFPHLAYVNPDAPKGGEMSIWAFGSFDSMHPYTVKGRAGGLASVFHESFLSGTADEIGAGYCLICETLEYPEDRSWVIFNLRPDVDLLGRHAADRRGCAVQLRGAARQGAGRLPRRPGAAGRSRSRCSGRTGSSTPSWTDIPKRDLPALVGGLPIFSKAEYDASGRDFEESSMTPMLGSGPYMIDRIDVGQTIVYRRNPDYWGWDLPLNVGRSNFDTIRIEYYADYAAAFEGFKGGSYYFRNEASSLSWATGYDFPAVANGWVVKRELADGTIATGQSFVFNLRREKFQDPRVREAIGLMFNFEWSNETLFYGIYERIHSFWENCELAATGAPAPEELAILRALGRRGSARRGDPDRAAGDGAVVREPAA